MAKVDKANAEAKIKFFIRFLILNFVQEIFLKLPFLSGLHLYNPGASRT